MKKHIKLYFTDFWKEFELHDNFFLSILNKKYDVEITEKSPDFLFYSVFGRNHLKYNCTRIFYTGENIRPDFRDADFAFTFDFIDNDPRHYRLPLYTFFNDVNLLLAKPPAEEIIRNKTRFCNFIYSNPGPRKRVDFFRKLSKYKKVDSGGGFMNNIGGRVGNKLEFISNYKFTIAFENESYPGYTTEKIFEPMLASSLPIYWGNPLVNRDFNPASFLNYHDYSSDQELIDRIIEIDNNDELFAEYLRQPWFEHNRLNRFVDPDNILRQIDYIINSGIVPVSSDKSDFSVNPLISSAGKFYSNTRYFIRLYSRRLSYINFNKINSFLAKNLGLK